MSLLSNSQKDSIAECFDKIHETFKKDIYIFVKEGPDIPVNANYNPLFGSSSTVPNVSTQRVEVKYTRQARVYYPDRMLERASKTLLNIPVSEGKVRIKVNSETMELLKKATKVEIDGDLWVLDGDIHPEGPFSINYYALYLKRTN